MKRIVYHCEKCNEPMEAYHHMGYVCMKDGCIRYGLLSVTAKIEEIEE